MNKIIQLNVENVEVFKRNDMEGMSIIHGSAYNMVMNPTLDVLSFITRDGWNFRGEKHILLYLNVFKHCLYAGLSLQVSRDVRSSIYTSNISSFDYDNNQQLVTNFASIISNTQL